MKSLLAEYVYGTPWALESGVFGRMLEVVQRHIVGGKLSDDAIKAAIGRDPAAGDQQSVKYQVIGSVAVIPISGIIAKHANQVNNVSQARGTALETVNADIARALADDTVAALLFRIESPGGSVMGLKACGDAIKAAGALKRTVAFYDDLACSAALWLGSQCQEVYCTETAIVGSIGVYGAMVDSYVWAQKEGLKVHKLSTGKLKGSGMDGTFISAEEIAAAQKQVDDYCAQFIQAIALGRELAIADVTTIADGRTFIGPAAVDAGLVDDITTFDALLADLAAGHATPPTPASGGSSSAVSSTTADTSATTTSEPITMKITLAFAMALVAAYPAQQALIAEYSAKAGTDDKITDASLEAAVLKAEVTRLGADATAKAAAHAAAITEKDAQIAKITGERDAAKLAAADLAKIKQGAAADVLGGPGDRSLANLSGDELFKAEFANDPKIQEAFGNEEGGYLAHRREQSRKVKAAAK